MLTAISAAPIIAVMRKGACTPCAYWGALLEVDDPPPTAYVDGLWVIDLQSLHEWLWELDVTRVAERYRARLAAYQGKRPSAVKLKVG